MNLQLQQAAGLLDTTSTKALQDSTDWKAARKTLHGTRIQQLMTLTVVTFMYKTIFST